MSAVFLKLLNMSITAGWIVIAVMLLRVLLKKMPKQFTCMLWGLVGLRLIFPFSLQSAFSLIPSVETVPVNLQPGELPEISSGFTTIDRVVNPAAKFSFSILSAGTSGTDAMDFLLKSAVIIWLAGMFLMLSYLLLSYLRLHRKLRTAVWLQANIWQSEFVDSPFILGLIKPRIYIPFHLNKEALSHVLAHERAHLARKDHLVKAFAFILLSVYWFQPLIWAAYILLCRDIELACDERVIRNLEKEERKRYLLSLIGYDREENRKKIPALACPLAFGEVDIKERILRAKNWKKPALILVVLCLIVCIVAALCLLTDPKKMTSAPEPFGSSYQVDSLVYDAPQYDFVFMFSKENPPLYVLTSDYQLMESADMPPGIKDAESYFTDCGSAEEIKLTEKNFTDYITIPEKDTAQKELISGLLKNNKNAWSVIHEQQSKDISYPDVLYYILQQKNGDVYLCYGYDDEEAPLIRWIFKLSPLREETLSAETLFSYRTKYIGDNSAVGNIIYNLTFPQDMAYQQFVLQTDEEPYEVTITFALSEEDKEAYAKDAENRRNETALLEKNACIMFALIENAGVVNYKLVNETDEDFQPLTLVYTRQWAEYETDCDLWKESATKEQLEAMLVKLQKKPAP